jgi:hypothetical protein
MRKRCGLVALALLALVAPGCGSSASSAQQTVPHEDAAVGQDSALQQDAALGQDSALQQDAALGQDSALQQDAALGQDSALQQDASGDASTGVVDAATVDATACPTPPGDLLEATLAGPGNLLTQRQLSGQIVAIPAPVMSSSSVQITFGETPSASTPQPVTLEISINRCRGVIDPSTTTFCNLRSTNGHYNSIVYFTRPYLTIQDEASAYTQGWCWAPESEGPWYINARWTYSECAFGSSTCGFAIQYNGGPF